MSLEEVLMRIALGVAVTLVTSAAWAAAAAGSAEAATSCPAVIGHRGALDEAPENTLGGIRHALDAGVDRVELDVHRTADGELVVIHDSTLSRTTNAEQVYPDRSPWLVQDFTLAQIRALDAGDGEQVPTLGQALELVGSYGAGVLVEAKQPDTWLFEQLGQQIRTELADHPGARPAMVTSFDHDFLRSFREEMSGHQIGAIFTALPTKRQVRAAAAWADDLSIRYENVTADWVEFAHRQGLSTTPWTVDTKTTMARMATLGADAVVTDRPSTVRCDAQKRRSRDIRPGRNQLREPVPEPAEQYSTDERTDQPASPGTALEPPHVGPEVTDQARQDGTVEPTRPGAPHRDPAEHGRARHRAEHGRPPQHPERAQRPPADESAPGARAGRPSHAERDD